MSLTSFFILLLVAYPFTWAVVALHELAHLLVGRWLGLQPYALQIGSGRLLYAGRVRGVAFSLHLLPSHGMVLSPSRYKGQAAWRIVLFFAAGPVSDCLVLLAMCAGLYLGESGTHAREVLFPLVIGQACILAINLLPMDLKIGNVSFANDGKQILHLLTGGAEGWHRRLHEKYVLNVQRYHPAFRAEDAWTLRANEEQLALYNDGCAASEAGRYQESLDKLACLLTTVPMHPGEEASILDRMTAPTIFHNELGLLPQALQCGRRAHALLPDCATLQCSYGALLVQSGQTSIPREDAIANTRTGLDMLLPLAAETHNLLDRVVSLYFIALAHQLLGNNAEADTAIASARKLGGDSQMLRHITTQLRERRSAGRQMAVSA